MKTRYKILVILISFLICSSYVWAQVKEIITLDEAIDLALLNSPTITISNANVDISRAGVKNAKSVYYPQISSRIVVPFIGRESGFFLDQLIYDFGRITNRVKYAKALLRSSKFDRDSSEDDLILNTIVGYYTVLAETHISLAMEKKVLESEKRLEQTQGFHQLGRVPLTEVTKAEVNLGNAKLEQIESENKLEVAKVNLMTTMGLEEKEFDFDLEDSSEVSVVTYELEDSIVQALGSTSGR